MFVRQDANWIATALTEAGTILVPELGIEVSLKDFYAGLDFPAEPPVETAR